MNNTNLPTDLADSKTYKCSDIDLADANASFLKLLTISRGRNTVRLLGDHVFYKATHDTLLRYKPDFLVEGRLKDMPSKDLVFLTFVHALTRFARWVIITRFNAGVNVDFPKTITQCQHDPSLEKYHIDHLLKYIDSVYYPKVIAEKRGLLSSKEFASTIIEPLGTIPLRPKFLPEQEEILSCFTHKDTFGPFALDLAYHILVRREIGSLTSFYADINREFLKVAVPLTRTNLAFGKILDIFWPKDGNWKPLADLGPKCANTDLRMYYGPHADNSSPRDKGASSVFSTNEGSEEHVNTILMRWPRLVGEYYTFPVASPYDEVRYRPGKMGPLSLGMEEVIQYLFKVRRAAGAVERAWAKIDEKRAAAGVPWEPSLP